MGKNLKIVKINPGVSLEVIRKVRLEVNAENAGVMVMFRHQNSG
jgi:hypothetical protein